MQRSDVLSSFHIPLSELLNLSVFEGSRVLGGKAGLSRVVAGINLTDTPDYFNWLNKNELLVTTCFAMRADEAALGALVPTLYRKGLAGVCIKPKRFIPEITRGMIESADRYGFPLVELPQHIRFSDITKAVTDLLFERQTDVLKRMHSLNDMLVSMILEGADLDAVARGVAELAGGSVLIVDSINDRSALFLSPLEEAAFACASREDICREIASCAPAHPLEVEGHRFGYLYLCGGESGMGAFQTEMLRQLSKTVPLEIARERSLRETEDVHFRDFFLHLIEDKITDERREQARGKRFGVDLCGRHLILRLEPSAGSSKESAPASALQRTLLYNELKAGLAPRGILCRIVRDEEELIVYLNEPNGGTELEGFSVRAPKSAQALFQKYPGIEMAGGCGRAFSGVEGLFKSDREARCALRVAKNMRKTGLVSFEEIGLLRLIYAEKPEMAIQAFIDEIIGPLLSMGRPRGGELLSTLESYFEHYGNLKKVSEATYTHYNTVVYRLKSIREITGLDLRVPEERFRMEIAMNLYRLLMGEKNAGE